MLESRKSSFSRPAGKSPILNKMAVFVLVKQGCTFAMRSSLYCENCDSEANSLRRKFKGVRFAFASLFEGPNSQKSENFCRILAIFNKNSFERARVRRARSAGISSLRDQELERRVAATIPAERARCTLAYHKIMSMIIIIS